MGEGVRIVLRRDRNRAAGIGTLMLLEFRPIIRRDGDIRVYPLNCLLMILMRPVALSKLERL